MIRHSQVLIILRIGSISGCLRLPHLGVHEEPAASLDFQGIIRPTLRLLIDRLKSYMLRLGEIFLYKLIEKRSIVLKVVIFFNFRWQRYRHTILLLN